MFQMHSRVFYLYLVIFMAGGKSCNGENIAKLFLSLRSLLKSCPIVPWEDPGRQNFLVTLRNCLQRQVLIAVDAFLDEDVIPILNGIDLIRIETEKFNSTKAEIDRYFINLSI